jgi:hypothetical protein
LGKPAVLEEGREVLPVVEEKVAEQEEAKQMMLDWLELLYYRDKVNKAYRGG